MTKITPHTLVSGDGATIPFSPPLALCFGTCAALLLQQIHYWTLVNPHEREGQGWCFNTYESWAEQLQIYTTRTINKEMVKLVEQGVVIVGNFNKHKYDQTRWYRLDYDKLREVFDTQMEGRWRIVPSPLGTNFLIHCHQTSQPIPKTNPKSNSNTPCEINLAKKVEEKMTEKTAKVKLPPPTVHKTTAQIQAEGMAKVQALKKLAKPNMGPIWKSKLATITGKTQTYLTMQDLGQLKKIGLVFIGAFGEEKKIDALDWVLNNWLLFSQTTKVAAGLETVPSQPQIGFLLKHINQAVSMYLQSIAPSVIVQTKSDIGETKAGPSASKPVTVKTPHPAPEDAPYKPTLEEMEETINSL